MLSIKAGKATQYLGDPFSYVFFPIYDRFGPEKKAVSVLFTAINWASYFQNLMPDNVQGLTLVLDNGCDHPYTYTIYGSEVKFEGVGDLHETRFNDMEITTSFADLNLTDNLEATQTKNGVTFQLDTSDCPYSLHVYPSKIFYNKYHTSQPAFITCAVAFVFVFTVAMFVM